MPGISRQHLYDLINGNKNVSAELAARLGKLFVGGPGIWLRLQANYECRAHRRCGAILPACSTPSGAAAGGARLMFLSVFDVFKIGIGPSSSHTMGPMTAANRFLDVILSGDWPRPPGRSVAALRVSLHGSLAFTGIGHGTGRAVILGLVGERPRASIPTGMDGIIDEVERTGRIHRRRAIRPIDSSRRPTWSSTRRRRCRATPTACSSSPRRGRPAAAQAHLLFDRRRFRGHRRRSSSACSAGARQATRRGALSLRHRQGDAGHGGARRACRSRR